MRVAATAAALATLLALAACSSDGGTTPTTPATTTRLTEITGPIPVPSVSVPVVSQPVPGVSSVAPGDTTLPPSGTSPGSSPGPATSEPGEAAPCDAPTLFAVAKASTELPPETGAEAPSCSPPWASMVVGVPGQERALGVFVRNPAGDWRLVNLGTDQVCSGAGVPPELYSILGCALWETE